MDKAAMIYALALGSGFVADQPLQKRSISIKKKEKTQEQIDELKKAAQEKRDRIKARNLKRKDKQ